MSSYWDRAGDFDAPRLPSFVPDQWYYRVAWAVLLVGVTVYVNAHAGGGGAGAGVGGHVVLGGGQ